MRATLMAQLGIRRLVSWWKPGNSFPQQGTDEILNLCKGVIGEAVHHLGAQGDSFLINSHQCDFLVRRLLETQDTLADYQPLLLDLDERAMPALQGLHQALVNAQRLIRSSCITDTAAEWLRAAIEQGDMKESFSLLLYEVQWHRSVLHSILVDHFRVSGIVFQPALCYGELNERDSLGLESAAKEDEWLLKTHLTSVIPTLEDPVEQALAHQMGPVDDQLMSVSFEVSYPLLKTQASSSSVSPATSNNLLFLNPQNLNEFYCGTLLGRGSFAEVRETTLLGGKYAIKIFDRDHTRSFEQEVTALQGLGHHPHIVRLLCYSKNKSKCFLIMEKMDMDLSRFLQVRKAGTTDRGSAYVEAVVLMLQIAEGARFIHKNHMAHRDLKPGNVLVDVDDLNNVTRALVVKIADFGLTKTKNASVAKADHTLNTGTVRYMAPELIKAAPALEIDIAGEAASVDGFTEQIIPKKADVYSFAIICCEILTGEMPFINLPNNEVKKHVKAGQGPMSRPSLPADCPERLASLIRRCWAEDLYERPDFVEICVELRDIKGTLLRKSAGEKQLSMPQTKSDAIVTIGSSSSGQRSMQKPVKMPRSQSSFSKRRGLPEQSLGLRGVLRWRTRRINSQTWNCPVVVLVIIPMFFFFFSLGAASYRATQHQGPSWEPNLDNRGQATGQRLHDGAHMPSMEVAIKQGPWGRQEPNKLTGDFDDRADSIKSIMLKYDQTPPRISAMEVEYVSKSHGEFKKGYCWNISNIGNKVEKIPFGPNEYIRRVSGSVDLYDMEGLTGIVPLQSVVSLTFHTNLQIHGPFGDVVGHRFTSGTGRVVGFFGVAGILLDQLGVWIIPDDESDHGDPTYLVVQ